MVGRDRWTALLVFAFLIGVHFFANAADLVPDKLRCEYRINPVLYFEYENINEASRISKEILGHAEPSNESLEELRLETAREIEAKLILSSDINSWNIAENFIVEKNLTEDEGFEFGYALGIFHPLSSAPTSKCRLCRHNLSLGLAMLAAAGFTFEETFGSPEAAWNASAPSAPIRR